MGVRGWTRALLAVIGLQLGGLGLWWIMPARGAPPRIATFDADQGLLTFVLWSEARADEAEFAALLEGLGDRTQTVVRAWSAETGTMVVRKDAVLSQAAGQTFDVTDEIMRRVLDDPQG